MQQHYEVIIIGAGTAGMAAGAFLAKKGVKTLLIDSFDPPHTNGSHHGDTRIIRHAYGEGEYYVPMAVRAQELWEELEQEVGETLFLKTGILGAGNADSPFIKEIIKSAKKHQLPLEVLEPVDVKARWPQVNVPDGFIGCYESNSGVLLAEKCISAFRKVALNHQAELWTNTRVQHIEIVENGVIVDTEKGKVYGDQCIVTAGAWTKKVVEPHQLPLSPVRKTVAWFDADEESFGHNHFPGFFFMLEDESYYGFPSINGSGVKVGRMDGGQMVDPDDMDRSFGIYEEDERDVRSFLETFMPEATGFLKQGKVCLFTRTPDEDFIIDHHPQYNHVIIATGFSGHGFKFASAIGEVLMKMALGEEIEYDLSYFRIGRF